AKARRHVKCFPFWNDAPGKKFALIVAAFTRGPKKIYSPLISLVHCIHLHRRDWDAHLGRPNVTLSVDMDTVLKARIPRSIVERVLGFIDFEIQPLVGGR